MARDRDERGTRYLADDHHREDERRHRRRHKSRDHSDDTRRERHKSRDYDDEARRERRERRRAEEARRQAEIDIDDLRARRESYYSRGESDRRGERMAQERRMDSAKEKSRSSHRGELRRDGSRRVKRKEAVEERSDDFVYGRPKSRGVVEDVNVRRSSALRRSEEGGSSRTAYSPRSGSGSTSGRRMELPKLSRSTSIREQSRGFLSSRQSVRRTSNVKSPPSPAPVTRTQSAKEPSRKGGILASLFRPPQSRTPVAATRKEVPRLVDCLVCMNDDLPVNKTVKLACGHRMCHSCLKRQFTLSVQDPQHMPPRCCTTEHIPLKYAERLFDDKFKILWNKKYQEYTTANRLYCPSKGCGQWVKPSRIRMDLTYGRKYARCGSCQTKICVLCNSKFHTRKECPKDEETNRLVEMAKEKGWQRCYNCKAVVELKEGCNHMTCRCTAQFCMVCAAPWKTCNCPWFNYQHVEDDERINDARIPYAANHDVVEVIEFPEEPAPPLARRPSTRTRHRSERSRDVDRADPGLAAQLQSRMRLDPRPRTSEVRRSDPIGQVYALGNAGGHHMNESYAVRSTPALAPRTSSRQSTQRTSFFGRRIQAPTPAPAPAPARSSRPATASAMAGLSRDGKKVGANRVGTWLTYIQVDAEAINTAPRNVEVDDWRCDGTMIGID